MNTCNDTEKQNRPICPICATLRSPVYRYEKNGFPIFSCTRCGVFFVFPQPTSDQIRKIYSENYFDRGNKYKSAVENTDNPNYRNDQIKVALLQKFTPTGTVLDIGCALGGFLQVAQEAGYNVSGIEISKSAVHHIQKNKNLDVICGELISAGLPDGKYDIVTMWDVIEHLSDPISYIKEIQRILKPGGILALTTGDIRAVWPRLAKRHWQLMTPPQHLFFFHPQVIKSLLAQNNFSLKDVRYIGKYATIDFILFKANESFGGIIDPIKTLARRLGVDKKQICINLHDIVTCIAVKER